MQLLTALLACSTSPGQPVLVGTDAYVDREILVGLFDDDDLGVRRAELERDYGLRTMEHNPAVGMARLELPDGEVPEVAALVGEDWRVEYAEPNYLIRVTGTPNDTYAGYQWNLAQVGTYEAWDITRGEGVVVAVLDSGVSAGPDGYGRLLPGYDFYYGDSDPSDGNGHGTFVAGTIAQATDNNEGVAGIAPGASILPVKVLSDEGYGDVAALVNGITWAADQGADVINMSLGSTQSSSAERKAVDYAWSKGAVLVAATGNEFASSICYPAAYEHVIAVGATRYDGTRAAYSNKGKGIDIMAPGGDLSKDQDKDGYADGILQETFEDGAWTYTFWEGTSMATPHVAAAAALLKSAGVEDPAEVQDLLQRSAVDKGSAGYDTTYGWGLLDIDGALALATGSSSGGSSGSTSGGSSGSTGGGSSGSTSGSTSSRDTTAPTISAVSGTTQGTRFTVQWTTNEPATSYVEFEGYGTWGDGTLTTSHTLTFTGSKGATYSIALRSADAAGNEAVDGWYTVSL